MNAHSRIAGLKAHDDGIYDLTTEFGKTLRIFVCECYSFGAAEYIETTQVLGRLDAIIINSAWCGYTTDAKRLARSNKVGLFTIGGFMSALNKAKLWDYLTKAEQELFRTNGWL